jgi:cytochrome c551
LRLAFLALPALLVACGGSAKDTAGTDTSTDTATGTSTATDSSADGAVLYSTYCASCHGANGQGGSGNPSLRDEVPETSDAELRDVILNGDGRMPAISVPSDDLPVLIAYLRTTFG